VLYALKVGARKPQAHSEGINMMLPSGLVPLLGATKEVPSSQRGFPFVLFGHQVVGTF